MSHIEKIFGYLPKEVRPFTKGFKTADGSMILHNPVTKTECVYDEATGHLYDLAIWPGIVRQRQEAAGPDLYDALKGIMEWMQQHHPKSYENCTKAKRALAKANGR